MTETREISHAELSRRMMIWAVAVLVGGLFVAFGGVQLLLGLETQNQLLFGIVDAIGRVVMFFGMPLAASLIVGAIVVRRL